MALLSDKILLWKVKSKLEPQDTDRSHEYNEHFCY